MSANWQAMQERDEESRRFYTRQVLRRVRNGETTERDEQFLEGELGLAPKREIPIPTIGKPF